MTIDAWMQHPTVRHVNHDMFASLRRWMGIDQLEAPLPLEMTIEAMDQGGVDLALASAWYGPGGELISNDEVAETIASHPERFVGLCGVDIRHPVAAVEEIRRRVDEGFVGVRIVPWLWERPPTDPLWYPVHLACAELGVPVCTQVGHTGPLRPSETGRPIPYIDQVALDFPELTIVCGHIGYPWTTEMIAVADKHENVVIDTSAYVAHRYPPELVDYLKGRGRSKVLFGTNYPMIQPAHALAGLSELGLPPDVEAAFRGSNAQRVFGLAGSDPRALRPTR